MYPGNWKRFCDLTAPSLIQQATVCSGDTLPRSAMQMEQAMLENVST